MDYEEYQEVVTNFYKSLEPEESLVASNEELGFSHRACECCKRPLGGDRWRVYAIKPERVSDENIAYSVCVDCLLYLEYGYLNDFNEGEELK